MKTFTYRKSRKIIQWGCSFDSLLELKYAISIRNEYEFLHAHIPIFYDPRTRLPTNYIRDNIRRYTPDFLIRHKITNEAFWVEIKPRAFDGNEQLLIRREVAENYIRWKNYDWKFKIVFSDEFKLKDEEHAQFVQACKSISISERKLLFKEFNDKMDRSRPSLFCVASSSKIQYVMFGMERILLKSNR